MVLDRRLHVGAIEKWRRTWEVWSRPVLHECCTVKVGVSFAPPDGANLATITPVIGSHYYLVIPLSPSGEGSYGRSSDGVVEHEYRRT